MINPRRILPLILVFVIGAMVFNTSMAKINQLTSKDCLIELQGPNNDQYKSLVDTLSEELRLKGYVLDDSVESPAPSLRLVTEIVQEQKGFYPPCKVTLYLRKIASNSSKETVLYHYSSLREKPADRPNSMVRCQLAAKDAMQFLPTCLIKK
jgi:hypothetical protein